MGVYTNYYRLSVWIYIYLLNFKLSIQINPEFVHSKEDFRKGWDLAFLNSLDFKGKYELEQLFSYTFSLDMLQKLQNVLSFSAVQQELWELLVSLLQMGKLCVKLLSYFDLLFSINQVQFEPEVLEGPGPRLGYCF